MAGQLELIDWQKLILPTAYVTESSGSKTSGLWCSRSDRASLASNPASHEKRFAQRIYFWNGTIGAIKRWGKNLRWRLWSRAWWFQSLYPRTAFSSMTAFHFDQDIQGGGPWVAGAAQCRGAGQTKSGNVCAGQNLNFFKLFDAVGQIARERNIYNKFGSNKWSEQSPKESAAVCVDVASC